MATILKAPTCKRPTQLGVIRPEDDKTIALLGSAQIYGVRDVLWMEPGER